MRPNVVGINSRQTRNVQGVPIVSKSDCLIASANRKPKTSTLPADQRVLTDCFFCSEGSEYLSCEKRSHVD